jgi:hypothetical protein
MLTAVRIASSGDAFARCDFAVAPSMSTILLCHANFLFSAVVFCVYGYVLLNVFGRLGCPSSSRRVSLAVQREHESFTIRGALLKWV